MDICYGDIVCLRKGKRYKAVAKSFIATCPNGLMTGFYVSSYASMFDSQLESFFENDVVPFPFGVNYLKEKFSSCNDFCVEEKQNGLLVTINGENFIGFLSDGDSVVKCIADRSNNLLQLAMMNMLLKDWKKETANTNYSKTKQQ